MPNQDGRYNQYNPALFDDSKRGLKQNTPPSKESMGGLAALLAANAQNDTKNPSNLLVIQPNDQLPDNDPNKILNNDLCAVIQKPVEVTRDDGTKETRPWILAQRWSSLKNIDPAIATVEVVGMSDLTAPEQQTDDAPHAHVVFVKVTTEPVDDTPSRTVLLQVPLELQPTDTSVTDDELSLGTVDSNGKTMAVYDLSEDHLEAYTTAWLYHAEQQGTLSFDPQSVDRAKSRLLGKEQSNTSLVFCDPEGNPIGVVKVYRQLNPGKNPDADVPKSLAAAGWQSAPEVLGLLSADFDGEYYDLACLSEFISGEEGYDLLKNCAKNSFPCDDIAREHGTRVAKMHEAMRKAYGTDEDQLLEEMTRAEADPDVIEAALIELRANRGLVLANELRARFNSVVESIPSLMEYSGSVQASYNALAACKNLPPLQRVHGDIHEGQLLGGFIVDFENEPAAPIDQRISLSLIVRDLAGMIGSAYYIAHEAGLIDDPENGIYEKSDWIKKYAKAFIGGYCSGSGLDQLELTDLANELAVALRAFEYDKTIYECGYEKGAGRGMNDVPEGHMRTLLKRSEQNK